jgi:hypothetical protein
MDGDRSCAACKIVWLLKRERESEKEERENKTNGVLVIGTRPFFKVFFLFSFQVDWSIFHSRRKP